MVGSRIAAGLLAILAASAGAASAGQDPARAAADGYTAAHQKRDPGRATAISYGHAERRDHPGETSKPTRPIWSGAGQARAQTSPFSEDRAGQHVADVRTRALKTPGARRTVLYYAHYDGQPISQKGWLSAPFTPLMRDGPLGGDPKTVDWKTAPSLNPNWRLFARSAGDDKASIQALLSAMDALKVARPDAPCR